MNAFLFKPWPGNQHSVACDSVACVLETGILHMLSEQADAAARLHAAAWSLDALLTIVDLIGVDPYTSAEFCAAVTALQLAGTDCWLTRWADGRPKEPPGWQYI